MKIKKEYYIKLPILLVFLLPFIVACFKGEQIKFSNIYYVGMGLSFLCLFDFKNEVVNNWIFALTIILFLISLIMIIAYFSM
jgi:predicted membrane channel-forming protein YqfA (hemolysin III family)